MVNMATSTGSRPMRSIVTLLSLFVASAAARHDHRARHEHASTQLTSTSASVTTPLTLSATTATTSYTAPSLSVASSSSSGFSPSSSLGAFTSTSSTSSTSAISPASTAIVTASSGNTSAAVMIDGTTGSSDIASILATMSGDLVTWVGASNPKYSIQLGLLTNFADPAIIQVDGVYYAYATNSNGINVQVAVSHNFRDWNLKSGYDALPAVGKWALQGAPHVWAPDVYQNSNGQFILTYSARPWWQYSRHCIGMAVASTPLGPFTPKDDVFVCPTDQGGAIDSSAFTDPITGNTYVVYKIDGNTLGHGGMCNNMVNPQHSTPIMLQRVAADGTTPLGSPVQIFDRAPQDGPLVEAPFLFYDAASQRYVLFYSSGCYADPTYDIAYVFSSGQSVLGPYVRQNPAGRPVQNGGVPSQRLLRNGTDGLHSPGGASVVAGPGRKVGIVFHGYTDGSGRRSMYTARIQIDGKRQLITALH